MTVHPGMYEDIENRDITNTIFGKSTLSSVKVDQVIKAQNYSGMAD